MLHIDLTVLLCYGYFGGIFGAFFIYTRGPRTGVVRTADSQGKMTFRKPMSERISMAMICVIIVAGASLESGLGVIDAVRHHHSLIPLAYIAALLFVVIAGALGRLLLYAAGPRDLYLDRNTLTYRYVFGWPIFSHVQTGPWEDMASVYVRKYTRSSSGISYQVEVAWRSEKEERRFGRPSDVTFYDEEDAYKQCKRLCPLLGCFRREESGDALAEEISVVLGLPWTVPPPVGSTSANLNSAALPLKVPKIPKPPIRPFRPTLFSQITPAESDTDTKRLSK